MSKKGSFWVSQHIPLFYQGAVFEVKTSLCAPSTVLSWQWMSLIRHTFSETLRVNSGEPSGGEFSIFWSEHFFVLGSEFSSVMLKVKRFSDNLGRSPIIFFCYYYSLFYSLQIFSRHKINDCIIFVISLPQVKSLGTGQQSMKIFVINMNYFKIINLLILYFPPPSRHVYMPCSWWFVQVISFI